MKYDVLYKSKLVHASALTLFAFLLFLGSVKSLRFAFVVAELSCLAIVAIIVGLIAKQTEPYDLDVRLRAEVHMPTPQEIEQAIARLHCALDGKSDTILNQPPNGAVVECEECDVQEIYPRGNDAAQSAHLLTHPTRCTVRT